MEANAQVFANPRAVARFSWIFFFVMAVAPATLLLAQSEVPAQPTTAAAQADSSKSSATASTPLSPEELGDLHMARKRYQAAIAVYHQADLNSAAVWNKIGIASQQMFMMDQAKKAYETSLRIDPKNPDVLNNLGTIHYSLKQYSIAEHLYRKALKLRPNSALISKNLGTDLLAEGKFKKGWECYQAALAIDPDIFERGSQLRIGEPTPTDKRGAMSYFLAKSYLMAGRTELAVEYLRMAIDQGFTDRRRIMADKEFAGLHDVTAFKQLISEQQRAQ